MKKKEKINWLRSKLENADFTITSLKKEYETLYRLFQNALNRYDALNEQFEKFKIESAVDYTDLEMNFRKVSKQGSETHDNLTKQVSSLQSQNERLMRINNDIDKRNAALNLENRELEKDVDDMQSTIEQKDKVIEHLQSEINVKDVSIAIADSIICELRTTIDQSYKSMENMQKKHDNLLEKISNYEKNINIKDIYSLQSEIEKLKNENSHLIKELQKARTIPVDDYSKPNVNVSELLEKIDILESEIYDLQKLIRSYEIGREVSIDCFNRVQDEKKKLENEITELKKEVERLNKELDNANNVYGENLELKSEIDSRNEIIDLKESTIGKLISQINSLESGIKQKESVISHLQSKYDAVCKRLTGYERNIQIGDCDFLRSEISDLESRIFELTKENESLQKENYIKVAKETQSMLEKRMQELKREIETLKSNPRDNEYTRNLELANKNLIETNKQFDKSNQFLLGELSHYKDICEKLAKKEFGIVNLEKDNTTQIKID